MSLEKILVVDDEVILAFATKILLEKDSTYQIDTSNDGLSAFNKYKETNYDAIIMDIKMPILNGIQATIKIRDYEKENNLKRAKIILFSAYEKSESDEIDYLIDGYIRKPFSPKYKKQIANIIENS